MAILNDLCSLPTAPFVEDRVVRYAEAFVAKRRGLKLSRDRFGNLLIELTTRSRGPRWIFGAHMDHPGMIARRMIDAKTLEADFHGGVRNEYVQGAKVRFFDEQGEVPGTIVAIRPRKDRADAPGQVHVRVSRPVADRTPGMFDLGEARIKNGLFYCRGIDDTGGAAAALTMLDQLHRNPPKANIAVLLTRAEEQGYIGAIAAATDAARNRLLRKTDRIIAIECSAQQTYAPLGGGVVVRIGDRTSIFNSDLTYFVNHHAEQLAQKNKTFRFVRALMPGGTCEASVYDIYGFVTTAVCIPLGNYHNMDTRRKKLAPEYIDLNDWKNMVRLFVHLARHAHEYEPGHKLLKSRVEQRFNRYRRLLTE